MVFNFSQSFIPTKIKIAIVLLNLTTLKQLEPRRKVNVNQYGPIYFKTIVKFVIYNSVQFETILCS